MWPYATMVVSVPPLVGEGGRQAGRGSRRPEPHPRPLSYKERSAHVAICHNSSLSPSLVGEGWPTGRERFAPAMSRLTQETP